MKRSLIAFQNFQVSQIIAQRIMSYLLFQLRSEIVLYWEGKVNEVQAGMYLTHKSSY